MEVNMIAYLIAVNGHMPGKSYEEFCLDVRVSENPDEIGCDIVVGPHPTDAKLGADEDEPMVIALSEDDAEAMIALISTALAQSRRCCKTEGTR